LAGLGPACATYEVENRQDPLPQFPCLENGYDNGFYAPGLLGVLSDYTCSVLSTKVRGGGFVFFPSIYPSSACQVLD
jgi:hypothetical protein